MKSLPAEDRAILARALDRDPGRRFPNCLALLEALERSRPGGKVGSLRGTEVHLEGSRTVLAELVAGLGGRLAGADSAPTWRTRADGEVVLGANFSANLPAGDPLACFDPWRVQWQAEIVERSESAVTFRLNAAGSLWERLVRRPAALLVEIHWTGAQPPAAPTPRATVHVRGLEKNFPADHDLLRESGRAVLLDLRARLQQQHERRTQDRWLWTQPVQVSFILADGRVSEPVDCLGKDVSLAGMGLYLPCAAPANDLRIRLTAPSRRQPITLTGTCVRLKPCGEDWYEAGIRIG